LSTYFFALLVETAAVQQCSDVATEVQPAIRWRCCCSSPSLLPSSSL